MKAIVAIADTQTFTEDYLSQLLAKQDKSDNVQIFYQKKREIYKTDYMPLDKEMIESMIKEGHEQFISQGLT